MRITFITGYFRKFPSPHSGILFLSVEYPNYKDMTADEFPSPHSGILFLSVQQRQQTVESGLRFRPLIRGFFFYENKQGRCRGDGFPFPSPHSGILFLSIPRCGILFNFDDGFPSPHSGILFLSCRYDMPPSLNIFAIFRRILHLLAQKGFPLTQSIHFSPYPSASARIKSFFIHIVPSPIPLNQYIITSSSFISPMPHDLTLVWS